MSTQLDPDTFRDLLDDTLADGPAQPPVTADVRTGRRALRRRRFAGAAAALSVVAVLGGTTYAAFDGSTGGSTDGEDATVAVNAAPEPATDSQLLEACQNGIAAAAREALYSPGTPTVHAVAHLGSTTSLAILAADGRAWGECELNASPDAEFAASVLAYRSKPSGPNGMQSGFSWSGTSCFRDTECPERFRFTILTRLPAEVAAVRVTLADNRVVTAATDSDGFVNVTATGDFPADPWAGKPAEMSMLDAFKRVDYLDSDGNILAAQMFDGTGDGTDGEFVDGYRPLSKYPALRSSEYID